MLLKKIILRLFEEFHLEPWNSCMMIALAESFLLDEVLFFYLDHHQSLS